MAGPSLVQFFYLACLKYTISVVVTALLVIAVSGFYRKKKKVLPVGYRKVGCGCLGREIASQLIAGSRYRVHSLDPPKEKMIAGVASYIQADITKPDDMRKALEGVEAVFHVAALTPFSIKNTHEAMMRVNVEGTRNVVDACIANGVKRLIHTSSMSDPVTTAETFHEGCTDTLLHQEHTRSHEC